VTEEELQVKNLQKNTFVLNTPEYTNTFLLCSVTTEAAGLLGTNFLEQLGAVIQFERGKISLAHIRMVPQQYSVSPAKYRAHTIFIKDKARRIPLLSQQETRHIDEQHPAGVHSETITKCRKTWFFRVKENMVVTPK